MVKKIWRAVVTGAALRRRFVVRLASVLIITDNDKKKQFS